MVTDTVKTEEVQEEVKQEEKAEKKERYFTRDELNKILAAEKTKAVEEIKKELAEAKRLENMTAEQKAKELEKKRQQELEAKEKEVNFREMKLQAIDIMSEKELPIKLVDFVIGKTAEETTERIEKLEEEFSKAVESHVSNRLKGSTPKEAEKKSYEPKPIKKTF